MAFFVRIKSPSIIESFSEWNNLEKEFQELENISPSSTIYQPLWSDFVKEFRKEIIKLNSIPINDYLTQKKLATKINYYKNLIKCTICTVEQPTDAHIAKFEKELTIPNWKKTLFIIVLLLLTFILFAIYLPASVSNLFIPLTLILGIISFFDPNNFFRENLGHCLQKFNENYIYNNFQNAGLKLSQTLKNFSSSPLSPDRVNRNFFKQSDSNTPKTSASPIYAMPTPTT